MRAHWRGAAVIAAACITLAASGCSQSEESPLNNIKLKMPGMGDSTDFNFDLRIMGYADIKPIPKDQVPEGVLRVYVNMGGEIAVVFERKEGEEDAKEVRDKTIEKFTFIQVWQVNDKKKLTKKLKLKKGAPKHSPGQGELHRWLSEKGYFTS